MSPLRRLCSFIFFIIGYAGLEWWYFGAIRWVPFLVVTGSVGLACIAFSIGRNTHQCLRFSIRAWLIGGSVVYIAFMMLSASEQSLFAAFCSGVLFFFIMSVVLTQNALAELGLTLLGGVISLIAVLMIDADTLSGYGCMIIPVILISWITGEVRALCRNGS